MSENNTITKGDVIQFMRENGWRKGQKSLFKQSEFTWHKMIDTNTRCNCNSDKNGVQISVDMYDMSEFGEELSFQISLRAEANDSDWIDFKYYSIRGKELFQKLNDKVSKLIKAWETINAN